MRKKAFVLEIAIVNGGGWVGGWVGVGEMELKKKESAWGRKRKIELNNKKEGGRRRKRRKMPKQVVLQ